MTPFSSPQKYIILLLVLLGSLTGCRSKKYEERIAQLEQELAASNHLITQTDSTMSLIAVMLDSAEKNEYLIGLDAAALDADNQDSVLLKIEGAKAYIAYSRDEIARLETQLQEEAAKTDQQQTRINGLLGTIRRLKKELQTKEDSLVALNDKILNLEEDNSRLASTVQKQQTELTEKSETIALQEESLEAKQKALQKQQEALEMQERATRLQKAEKFFALGKQEEILGDKTKFAPNKKKQYYESAESYYQQAYELGKVEAKEAMYNAKQKAIKVKFSRKDG